MKKDIYQHFTGYKVVVNKLYKNGKADCTVIDCKESRKAFGDSARHLPFGIRARNFYTYFKPLK